MKSQSEGIKPKQNTASINDYELFGEIGEGAYGLVKLGKDKKTGETVAIKAVSIKKIC